LSFGNEEKKYGGFVQMTDSATGKSLTWRVSRPQIQPAVAFSPDGTKLAGAVTQRDPSEGTKLSIVIWSVPK
jgi:hypothetical protein